MISGSESPGQEDYQNAQRQRGTGDLEKSSSFFYFEKIATCDRHDGVKISFELSKHSRCPLCAALNKIAYYETLD